MGERTPRRRSTPHGPCLSEVEDDKDVPPAILEDIKATFHLFDQDDSGTIDPKEIQTQMRGLGFEADNTTIYTFINDLDSDGSQTLEFGEFFSMMKDTLRIHEPQYNARDNIAEIFDFMDDPDPAKRNGRIDCSSLRWIASALGDQLSEEEVEAMVRGADRDGKGYVDPEDFYELMVRGASRPIWKPPNHDVPEHHDDPPSNRHSSVRGSHRHSGAHHGHSVTHRGGSVKHTFRRSSSASDLEGINRRSRSSHTQGGKSISSDATGASRRHGSNFDAARHRRSFSSEALMMGGEAAEAALEVAGRLRGDTS